MPAAIAVACLGELDEGEDGRHLRGRVRLDLLGDVDVHPDRVPCGQLGGGLERVIGAREGGVHADHAVPALAQEASLEAVLACRVIEDPAERVGCYDAALGRLEEAEAQGEVKVITRAEVEKVQRESFGFRIPSLPSFGGGETSGATGLERVTEPVKSVSGAGGKLRITLENGSVWQQIDDKKVRARDVQSAEIFQATMGSYKMKLDGGLAFRVRREN